jgi:hypothetical protein
MSACWKDVDMVVMTPIQLLALPLLVCILGSLIVMWCLYANMLSVAECSNNVTTCAGFPTAWST